jgi:hypothetical protein
VNRRAPLKLFPSTPLIEFRRGASPWAFSRWDSWRPIDAGCTKGAESALWFCWANGSTVALKNPDAIAAVVTALRLTHGDEMARAMLVGGMSLAALIEAMFSASIERRDAIRYVASALDDFAISPEPGPVWHLRYVYESHGSFRVVDMEIATPTGTLSSKDVWLRLPV